MAAATTGVAQPRHAHPFAEVKALHRRAQARHLPDDLVAQDQGQLGLWKVPVDDVQVGAADAAGAHTDQQLVFSGPWGWQVGGQELPARCLEHHALHGPAL